MKRWVEKIVPLRVNILDMLCLLLTHNLEQPAVGSAADFRHVLTQTPLLDLKQYCTTPLFKLSLARARIVGSRCALPTYEDRFLIPVWCWAHHIIIKRRDLCRYIGAITKARWTYFTVNLLDRNKTLLWIMWDFA